MPLNLFGSKEKHRIDYQGDKALFENAQDEYTENSKVTLVLHAEDDTIYEVRKDKYEITPVNRSTDRLTYEFYMPRRDVKIQVIKTSKKQKEILLYDYYSRVTGTAVPRPYYEIQVYQLADGNLKAVEIVDGGSRDKRINRYNISGEMKKEMEKLIEEYDLEGWNKLENYEVIDGKAEYIRYLADNTYIIASVNMMPEDGLKKLGTIVNTLREYLK